MCKKSLKNVTWTGWPPVVPMLTHCGPIRHRTDEYRTGLHLDTHTGERERVLVHSRAHRDCCLPVALTDVGVGAHCLNGVEQLQPRHMFFLLLF